MNSKRLFLIDGNSFCYRAFYAIKSLQSSKGQQTNAVYGFATMLNRIINEQHPDYLAVCFDLKGPTFRHEKYAEYKAHRKPMPDDLVSQLPVIKSMISAYNIPIYERQGYEADDLIATIAKKSSSNDIQTYIVTADKDALQLVCNNIKVYNAHKDIVYDSALVKSKYGVSPSQIADLMALAGDASDNIPGVPGIGEKTAVDLIRDFGDLESLLSNVSRIKSDAKRKLIESGIEQARLSKELATVDTNVSIEIDFDQLKIKKPDRDMLIKIFKELEFKKLLKEVMPQDALSADYSTIKSVKELQGIINELESREGIAFDFETTHYDPMIAEPVGISFSWEKGKAIYIPFNATDELRSEVVLKKMKHIFQNDAIKKIGQNIKYEYIILRNAGIDTAGIYFDTMIASYLVNPARINHSLDELSIEYLNNKMTPIEDLIGKGKKAITMDKVDIDKVSKYCCADSDATYRLKEILEKRLKENDAEDLFFRIEMPLVEVLASMEIEGVSLDEAYLKKISKEMEKELDKYQGEIYKLANEEFNINSPKQLQEILFGKLKLPVVKRTKTGASTDEKVLKSLAQLHELPKKILKYREYSKLKSTYVDALPDMINKKTGKLHTSFNQTVTQTGRLSSSNPNIQNIPIKTEEGKKIRRAFIASGANSILVTADYSQIELRVLAHLSGDEALTRAFKENKDIHTFTASLIHTVEEKDVTQKMRNIAKTANFGIVYGMSPFGLSQELGINVSEAKEFIDNYFNRYPGVKTYLEDKVREAQKRKYVATVMGRRRFIPEIGSSDIRIRSFAERTAINAPIQGSAADIIKMAMIRIYREMNGMKSKMILQVHDELVFNVAKEELNRVLMLVKKGMENIIKLNVPLPVNIRSGKNWLDTEDVLV